MSVLLVCTPNESYATPFLQNSRDEVVVDTSGEFAGAADRVVVTGVAATPDDLRAAVDIATRYASGAVDIGPLVGTPAHDQHWTTALTGLRLVAVANDDAIPVVRVQADPQASEIDAAVVVGALMAVPQSTIEPESPASVIAAPSTPTTAPSTPTKPKAPKAKPAPPQSLAKRVIKQLRRRRKPLLALVVLGLAAMAFAAGAYALAGGYYTAVIVTAIIALVALSALRMEQQLRRLLRGDGAFQTKQAARSAAQFKRLARSMGVVELTSIETSKMLSRTEGTARVIRADLAHHFQQVQATFNLFHLVRVDGMLPPMRGWAASPDVVGVLVEELRQSHPALIVECGSGVSTLWLALAAQQHSPQTRIVALDHDAEYAGKTRELLARHGVSDFAEVRHAPLSSGADGQPWYDLSAVEDLTDIGLLFVDGPPMSTGPLARMPALPVLWERLAPKGVIVLDDMIRDAEQSIAAAWQADHPELIREDVHTEKGTAILRR